MAQRRKRTTEDVDAAALLKRTQVTPGHLAETNPTEEFFGHLRRWAQRSVLGHARTIDR